MLIKTKFNGYARDGLRVCPKGGSGSKEMKQQEAQRQARIQAAVDTINGVFNGKPTVEVSGRAGSYSPGQVYYDKDGNQFTAPMRDKIGTKTLRGGTDNDSGGRTVKSVIGKEIDQNAISRAIQEGLFTEKKVVAPPAREVLYDQHEKAVFDINKLDVDKQFTQAERNARFGLARSGLMGGSEDIDARADLQDRMNKGLIQSAALGDSAAAELKNQDERARQSLISMAQSGIDTGTAQSMAMKQLDAAAQAASGNAKVASIGDLFGDMSQAWMLNQKRQGMIDGRALGQQGQSGVGSVRTSYSGEVK